MAGGSDISPMGRSPKLYQRACDIIASEIRSGEWDAHRRLTETSVAERLGISRAPARQALAKLETMGLLRRTGRRGYEAVGPSERPLSPAVSRADEGPEGAQLRFQASWELIYRQVETAIVSRTSLGSWRINEVAMAKSFRVSRTVAREVIARLQQRGLVSKDRAGRWIAIALDARHIAQLYGLRQVLEPLALQQAMARLPPHVLAQVYGDLRKAIDTGGNLDGDAMDVLEQQLHVDLLTFCDNPPLMQAISLPQAVLVSHHRLYKPKSAPRGAEPFLLEHLQVFEHLLAGDGRGARQALIHHLKVSGERALARIEAAAQDLVVPDIAYLEPMHGAAKRVD